MVKIRLQRYGAKKAPFYHIVVADSRSPRDGRIVEQIGTYDPMKNPAEIKLDMAKVETWIKNGAKPTDTVKALIEKSKYVESQNNRGETALFLAIVKKLKNIALKIVDKSPIAGIGEYDAEVKRLLRVEEKPENIKEILMSWKNEAEKRGLNKKLKAEGTEKKLGGYEKLKASLEILKLSLSKSKKNQVQNESENIEKKWDIYFSSTSSKEFDSLNDVLRNSVNEILEKLERNPNNKSKTGEKVESLTGGLEGLFSRRINGEHRLVYKIDGDKIHVLSCVGHYNKLKTKSSTEIRRLSSVKSKWENNELVPLRDAEKK